MNEIINKFLLAGDKCMSEMDLRQPGFTYSACGPFNKNKKRIQKIKEIRDSKYIYQSELDKPCFQHNMLYGDFKDLPRRTITNKILHDKAFNMIDINANLLQWFILFLIKKTSNTNKGAAIKSVIVS